MYASVVGSATKYADTKRREDEFLVGDKDFFEAMVL